MATDKIEYTLFNRETQNVEYPHQPDAYDLNTIQTVNLLFEFGKWYRVAYRRGSDDTSEFIFLEHPEYLGLAIGFRRDSFF